MSTSGNTIVHIHISWKGFVSCRLASTVGKKNPIRYRGYYYDTESNLYYLNSRYYDPETGRFISADVVAENGSLYVYCANDPINRLDIYETKSFWQRLKKGFLDVANWIETKTVAVCIEVKSFVDNTFGGSIIIKNNDLNVNADIIVGRYETGAEASQTISGNFDKAATFYAQTPNFKRFKDIFKFAEYKIGMQVSIAEGGFDIGIGGNLGPFLKVDNGDVAFEAVIGPMETGFTISQDTNFKNRSASSYGSVYVRPGGILAVIAIILGNGATQSAALGG